VLEQFQGEQIGTKMLFKAIEIAFDKNKKHLWLGVWEKNTDAIRFYQKHGFLKFNTHPYYIGKDKQTDWLMRFDLSTFNIDSK
jgi:ribosomal protein S18 acetylase RimI-like enzyme